MSLQVNTKISASLKFPGRTVRSTLTGFHRKAQKNLYLLEFGSNNIGRIDAKTKEFKIYSTITRAPGRGAAGSTRKTAVVCRVRRNGVGMLDPKSGKIQEWQLPIPWSAPYHVVPDKNGEVWPAPCGPIG